MTTTAEQVNDMLAEEAAAELRRLTKTQLLDVALLSVPGSSESTLSRMTKAALISAIVEADSVDTGDDTFLTPMNPERNYSYAIPVSRVKLISGSLHSDRTGPQAIVEINGMRWTIVGINRHESYIRRPF